MAKQPDEELFRPHAQPLAIEYGTIDASFFDVTMPPASVAPIVIADNPEEGFEVILSEEDLADFLTGDLPVGEN